jgi:methyl-accepting chemotaxis protein
VSSIIATILYSVLHHQARMRLIDPENYTAEVTQVILLFAVGFSALTAGGVALWSLVVTHRICGPLYVLDRYLTQLAGGRLPFVRPLRRKDEFKQLMANFSQAIGSVRQNKQMELAVLDEVARLANDSVNDPAGRQQALQSIAAKVETLARQTRTFLGEDELDTPAAAGKPAFEAKAKTAQPLGKFDL